MGQNPNSHLCRKADVTATDMESYTPLMLAVLDGHVEAFRVLLSRDSAIDETDKDRKTIVHLAAERNHLEILEVCKLLCYYCMTSFLSPQEIMKNKDGFKLFKSTDTNYNTPLHLAASKGNREAVELFLQSSHRSIKVDTKNELNKTPMHLAASKGHVLYVCFPLTIHRHND